MGFFAEFDAWLSSILALYVSTTTAQVAAAIEPAVMVIGVLYVMGWGFLHMTGRIEEPFLAGAKRIGMLVLVIAVGLRMWMYNDVLVDTFSRAPGQLAARVIGAPDPVTIVDQIIFTGGDAASALIEKGSILDGSFAFILAGFVVYAVVGVTALYTMFLLALSRVAIAVLLALGPLFIAMLFFEGSRKYFERWLTHLVNYALVTILTVMVVALLMRILTVAAQQASDVGAAIEIAHAMRLCLAAGLVLLVLRQVTGIAAGLAHGSSLHSFGVVGLALGGVARGAASGAWRAGQSAMQRPAARRAPTAGKGAMQRAESRQPAAN
jgi:type IV secretion system protein VirB6